MDRRPGKAAKAGDAEDALIPPLHLVLVEEPEAHLHAQVQQVFIKQAGDVLQARQAKRGQGSPHGSSSSARIQFTSPMNPTLNRCGTRRLPVKAIDGAVPVSCVVNLSEIFGSEDETARFAKRYLKATHCDLFFADGAVLVEGPAERSSRTCPHAPQVRFP